MDQGFFARGRRQAARIVRDQFIDVWVPATLPEVTVLMPIFQQERFVAEAVTSILEQRDIACEILICDDNSPDRTWHTALQTLATFLSQQTSAPTGLVHSVRVRRNSRTLGRMNIHEMAVSATTDIRVQAHGDDVSHPERMRRIANAFLNPAVRFVTSGMRIIDEAGNVDSAATITPPEGFLSIDTALSRAPWTIGAVEAWHASLLTEGHPLTMDYAPVAHDRIMAIRAALHGTGFCISDPLVDRRVHAHQWSQSLVDNATLPTQEHGLALFRSMLLSAAIDEIDTAEFENVISAREAHDYRARCQAELSVLSRKLRSYAGQLMGQGQRLVWTEESPS